jgi:hypothetical protein
VFITHNSAEAGTIERGIAVVLCGAGEPGRESCPDCLDARDAAAFGEIVEHLTGARPSSLSEIGEPDVLDFRGVGMTHNEAPAPPEIRLGEVRGLSSFTRPPERSPRRHGARGRRGRRPRDRRTRPRRDACRGRGRGGLRSALQESCGRRCRGSDTGATGALLTSLALAGQRPSRGVLRDQIVVSSSSGVLCRAFSASAR